MITTRFCPQCQQPLSADAPAGLCPQCLMKAAAGPLPSEPQPVTTSGRGDVVDIGDPVAVGKCLPQFEIIELLGRGGMGVVYKARQLNLDRVVALKILPPAEAMSADFIERFRREARSLAKLSHPNIVAVHDFGESGGLYYFAMEFVDGVNLREMIRTGRMKPAEALAVVPRICDALQFAHEEGVVHRDIKPENILIDKRGRVKIADFGLAKLLRREHADHTLTMTGMTLGTPRYMAPEQLDKPETVDHRADIYSLGVVFYEMLTGEVPMGRFAPPSEKVQVDVKLDEIVLRSLERDVERRYQHASEVKTAVESVAQAASPSARQFDFQPAGGSAPRASAPAPASLLFPIQSAPRSARDLLMGGATGLIIGFVFLLLPGGIVYLLATLAGALPATALGIGAAAGLIVFFGTFALLGTGSIASLRLSRDGITINRHVGPSRFVPWAAVQAIEPMTMGQVVREVALWPGIPPRGSILCMTAEGWLRINCQGDCWYFNPRNSEHFLNAVAEFRKANPDTTRLVQMPADAERDEVRNLIGWPAFALLAVAFHHFALPVALSVVLTKYGTQLTQRSASSLGGTHAMWLGCMLAAGIVIFAGGVRMLRLRSHGFAVLASVIACIPLGLLYIPRLSALAILNPLVGLWALVTLLRPKVRAAFREAPHAVPEGDSSAGKLSSLMIAAGVLAIVSAILTALLVMGVFVDRSAFDAFFRQDSVTITLLVMQTLALPCGVLMILGGASAATSPGLARTAAKLACVPLTPAWLFTLPLGIAALSQLPRAAGQPQAESNEPRLNRCALWGAMLLPLWLVAVAGSSASYFTVVRVGVSGSTATVVSERPGWSVPLAVAAGVIAVVVPFLSTILGAIAIGQIKRSAGKTYGLRLGAAACLTFPVLLLGALAAGAASVLWTALGLDRPGTAHAPVPEAIAGIVTCIVAGMLGWRAIRGPKASAAPSVTAPAILVLIGAVASVIMVLFLMSEMWPNYTKGQFSKAGMVIRYAALSVFAGLAVVAIRGSLKMLGRENYAASRQAALCSIFSIVGIITLPAGIWALVTLGRPEVKALFPSGSEVPQSSPPGAPEASSQPKRHLLSACLVLVMLFAFFFGFSFQARMGSGTAAGGRTEIVTVGALDPLYVSESGPSGFQTSLNFFSWSFFAVVVAMVALSALWRIGREDAGKVARDPAWWRGWWKQVGVWGGLVLVACIFRTVKDPVKVLQPPGDRTVASRFMGLFTSGPEFREDPSRIPATRTAGRTDYAYSFAAPANHRLYVWIEWWKDGKRTIDRDCNTAYVARRGDRLERSLQVIFNDGNIAGPATKGQVRIDWLFDNGKGNSTSGRWRPNFFEGLATSVDLDRVKSWKPKVGETVNLLEIRGGKESIDGNPVTEERLRAGRWEAVMILRARVEAVPESRTWEGTITKMNAWNDNEDPSPALLRLGGQFGATLDAFTDVRNLREQIAYRIKMDPSARAKAGQFLRDAGVSFAADEAPEELVKKLEGIVQGLAEEPAKP